MHVACGDDAVVGRANLRICLQGLDARQVGLGRDQPFLRRLEIGVGLLDEGPFFGDGSPRRRDAGLRLLAGRVGDPQQLLLFVCHLLGHRSPVGQFLQPREFRGGKLVVGLSLFDDRLGFFDLRAGRNF